MLQEGELMKLMGIWKLSSNKFFIKNGLFDSTCMLKWKQSAHDQVTFDNANNLLYNALIEDHSINSNILG